MAEPVNQHEEHFLVGGAVVNGFQVNQGTFVGKFFNELDGLPRGGSFKVSQLVFVSRSEYCHKGLESIGADNDWWFVFQREILFPVHFVRHGGMDFAHELPDGIAPDSFQALQWDIKKGGSVSASRFVADINPEEVSNFGLLSSASKSLDIVLAPQSFPCQVQKAGNGLWLGGNIYRRRSCGARGRIAFCGAR
jgi:hypothetical protein